MSQPDPLPRYEPPAQLPRSRGHRGSSAFWAGGLLVLVGAYFLLQNLGLIRWLSFDLVWPAVLIVVGLWLVLRRLR